MCEIWLKSVHRGLLYDYVKYNDFVTFCTFSFLSFLPARRYASAGLYDSDVSVCLSICHTAVLCLAERKQDREMYTI